MRWSELAEARRAIWSAPEVLYHGSLQEVGDEWWPLTHFGTKKAALERGIWLSGNFNDQYPIRLYEVRVSISNALRLNDRVGLHHKPGDVLKLLAAKGLATDDHLRTYRRKHMYDFGPLDHPKTASTVVQMVADSGYDGIVYRNKSEDVGADSWMNFYPRQISTISKVLLTRDEAKGLV